MYVVSWYKFNLFPVALRTVGIPARPITNFQSAHDSDFSRSIDYYYDKNNKMVSELSSDSVWYVIQWNAIPDFIKFTCYDGSYNLIRW